MLFIFNYNNNAWIYPKECNICYKYKIQHKGKSMFPTKLTTTNAAKSIKSAAEKYKPDLFFEIEDLDLITKEFKYHQTPCYKSFTKDVNSATDKKSKNDTSSDTNEKGDFKGVEM